MIYLTEEHVQNTLSVAEAVDLAERGIRADGRGEVAGDKFYMPVGDAGFIKPFSGYIRGEEYAYVKTFSFFPRNPEHHDLPTTSSLVLLFDARTGFPVCVMEAGWATGLKTCASTTVTAASLANPDADTLAIFGAGLQGRLHLEALATRFNLSQVWVLDILPDSARRYAQEMGSKLDLPIEAVTLEDRAHAVRDADMVITVTTGDQPLVELGWLKPGAFVAKLGSYQEVALDVVTGADKVIVDRWKYLRPRAPELIRLAEAGEFSEHDVHAEWPEIVGGRRPGREAADEIILFMALGIWGEYAAILPAIYRRAVEKGLGSQLPE
jgi:ornithine cyclodeaminase/alanine dehydrogenase-like protein (mu-crystallin family)